MTSPSRLTRPVRLWSLLLGAALLLLVPGPNWILFDGLPLSSPIELLALVALVLAAVSREGRDWLDRRVMSRVLARPLLLVAPLAVLALKLTLLGLVSDTGFAGCYRSPLGSPPGCETSYENEFGRGSVTRYDRHIDFGPSGRDSSELVQPAWLVGGLRGGITRTDWNLGFVNQVAFNLFRNMPGDGNTEFLPIEARWTGTLDRERGGRARVTYVGEGQVTVRGRVTPLPAVYKRVAQTEVRLPAGRSAIEVRYRLDNGLTPGAAPPRGPWAQLRIEDSSGQALASVGPPFIARAGGWLVDLALLGLLGLLAAAAVAALRVDGAWKLVAGAAGLGLLGLVLPAPVGDQNGALFVLAPAALLVALALRPRPGGEVPAAIASLLTVNLLRSLAAFPALQGVIFRRPGSDWLTYESFAREILRTGSLQAGEDVFYFQPGFRFINYGLHALLGDGDVTIGILVMTMLGCSVVLSTRWLIAARGLTGWAAVPASLAGASAAVVVGMPDVTALVRIGISEYWTWILTPPVVALVLGPQSRLRLVSAFVLMAVIFSVRTNQAPALALLALGLVVIWFRRSPRTLAAAVAVSLAIVALLPLHNLAYGGDLRLLPTNVSVPGTQRVPTGNLLNFASSADVRERLADQARLVLFLGSDSLVPRQQAPPLAFAFHVALVLWLLSMALVVRRWRATSLPARLIAWWPLSLLLFYVVFDPRSAYPRHITIAYVAMGIVSAFVLADQAASMASGGRRRWSRVSIKEAWRRGIERGAAGRGQASVR